MDRLLIVPAAGRGSRLHATGPKALVPVAGRPMLDYIVDLHKATVDRVVVVVAPSAVEAFRAHVAGVQVPIEIAVQPEPTGMLDAILAAAPLVSTHRPARIVITWCDQIALQPQTITALEARALAEDRPALVLATLVVERPYIHFDRAADGRFVAVRQRREGDDMPEQGETDMGLFDLSLDAYLRDLVEFSRQTQVSQGTGERNFLPFIPWLAARAHVESVAGASAMETVGINTPEELATIEAYLTRKIVTSPSSNARSK